MGNDTIVLDHDAADQAISGVECVKIESVGLSNVDTSTISASASMSQAYATSQNINDQISSSLQTDLGKVRKIGLAFDAIDKIEISIG